jgi:hypothetical protein
VARKLSGSYRSREEHNGTLAANKGKRQFLRSCGDALRFFEDVSKTSPASNTQRENKRKEIPDISQQLILAPT